jgi:hypothetical protein
MTSRSGERTTLQNERTYERTNPRTTLPPVVRPAERGDVDGGDGAVSVFLAEEARGGTAANPGAALAVQGPRRHGARDVDVDDWTARREGPDRHGVGAARGEAEGDVAGEEGLHVRRRVESFFGSFCFFFLFAKN